MKKDTLREALNRIDDDLITEAGNAKPERRMRFPAVACLAACLAVLVCAAAFLPKLLDRPADTDLYAGQNTGMQTDVTNANTGKRTTAADENAAIQSTVPLLPPDFTAYQKLAVVRPVYPELDVFSDRSIADTNPISGGFSVALNDFALRTASAVIDAEHNALYSPLSLYYALALSAAGARGDTQTEILALLGVSDAETLAEQCGNLYRLLYLDNDLSQLRLANSLWVQEGASFHDGYLKTAADNYYASLFSVDFGGAETGRAMAAWIADNTNGTLSYEYTPDPQQVMSILNAVYFRAEWQNRFNAEKTAKDLFTLASGETVACDFMNSRYVSHGFAKGDGFTRSALSLKNAGYMVFILPDEGVSASELLASPKKIEEIFFGGEAGNGEVIWQIPKFSYGASLSLSGALKALGMDAAFDPARADFSAVSDDPLWIGSIAQNTHISIDENGVEASAFTEIQYAGAAIPEGSADMRLTRPFIYGIVANGQLLFIGVCANPAA